MSSSHARLFRRRGSRSRTPRPGSGLLSVPAGLAGRLEHADKLDRVTQPLAEAIRSGLPTGSKADALHGVWLGQPVHPALVALPMGFWTSATVLDFVPGAERASRLLLALGLAGTLPAAAAGLAIRARSEAANSADAPAPEAGRDNGGRLLALGGLAAVTTGGFLGRHLAFGLGAGASHAEPVAHLTALGWHDL